MRSSRPAAIGVMRGLFAALVMWTLPLFAEGPARAELPPELESLTKKFVAVQVRMRHIQSRFLLTSSNEEKLKLREDFVAGVDEGNQLVDEIAVLAEREFAEYVPQVKDPAADTGLRERCERLSMLALFLARRDRFEEVSRLCELMIDSGYADLDKKKVALYGLGGIGAFELGEFSRAELWLQKAKDAGVIDEDRDCLMRLHNVGQVRRDWDREMAIRQQEAQADDLPRVKLQTTRGDIVLELFENEAPNTVANFISLVEKRFYNDRAFYDVAGSLSPAKPTDPDTFNHGVVIAGCPKDDGTGGPGYRIKSESTLENRRNHFRGSVSMRAEGRDAGGSRFIIFGMHQPARNGRETVFGRVIEGMEIVSKLRQVEPKTESWVPRDRIISATVLRKRDHEYVPETISAPAEPEKKPKVKVGIGTEPARP